MAGKDHFTPSTHLITHTDLTFNLVTEKQMEVTALLKVKPNPESSQQTNDLVLDGDPKMALLGVTLNGQALDKRDYTRKADKLTVHHVPSEPFTLEVKTRINPWANNPKNISEQAKKEAKQLGLSAKAAKLYDEMAVKQVGLGHGLTGIYTSNGQYMSQCEAEGFRNITFYLDEPSVLAEFTTTVIGDKGKMPFLLSNGNLVEEDMLDNQKQKVKWHDPFPKPSYLFAFVGGDFDVARDQFTTMSGRDVALEVYVDKGDLDKSQLALDTLAATLKYEEERWNREYGLDRFMVAVSNEFNMGAMENTGLNIYNPSAVLANSQMATDAEIERKEGVLAHETFHYHSGNRITLNHWSQLTLKEGLTVYRDQEFTSDHHYRPLVRMDNVAILRAGQFADDAGPDAQPIRPAEFTSVENLYNSTIYEKGAEVIRMIHTLLGRETFDKALTEYFERFDGQAVSTADFVAVMAEVGNKDLSQFERTWYDQAGTPRLQFSDEYDASAQTYRLTVKQILPDTPDQKGTDKEAHHIPVRIGLLDGQGNDMKLTLAHGTLLHGDVLEVTQKEQVFEFLNVAEKPLPSLLRGFSAPVISEYPYTPEQLAFLMTEDADEFNRWDAGQRFAIHVLGELVRAHEAGKPLQVDARLIEAYRTVLADDSVHKGVRAAVLGLPSFSYLEQILYPNGNVDIDALDAAKKTLEKAIANGLQTELKAVYDANRTTEGQDYAFVDEQIHERSLKNRALYYLAMADDNAAILQTAEDVFTKANNHTDERAALVSIIEYGTPEARNKVLKAFYDKWKHEALVLDKWFSLQARADQPDVLEQVKALTDHPDYSLNPNRVRSLIGAFAMGNPVHFHRADGQGYAFLANQIIELDKSNPTLASRLVGPLLEWEKYDTSRQQLMVGQLVRVLHVPDLSPTTKERVAKGVKVAHDKGITEEGKAALNAMKATEGTAADVTAANVPLSQEEEEIRQALLKAKGEFLVTIPVGAQALEAVGQ